MHFSDTLHWAGTENITEGNRTNLDDHMPREKGEKWVYLQDSHLIRIHPAIHHHFLLAQSRNQLDLAWTIQKLVMCTTTTLLSSPRLFLLFQCASCPSD